MKKADSKKFSKAGGMKRMAGPDSCVITKNEKGETVLVRGAKNIIALENRKQVVKISEQEAREAERQCQEGTRAPVRPVPPVTFRRKEKPSP